MRMLEGLWEEIESQVRLLRGKRVRVVILDSEGDTREQRDWSAFFADLLSRPPQVKDYDFESLRREHFYEERL